jgi:thiol-disulfide isomerase/thioredoxin
MIRRRPVALAFSAVLASLLMAGCSGTSTPDTGAGFVASDPRWTVVPEAEREPAPAISGSVLGDDGTTYDLADHRGEVGVINVWGSWCSPCRAEADTLQAMSEELAPQGVTFLGINTRDDRAAAEAFLAAHDTTYPSIVDTDGAIQVAFRDSLPAVSIPTTWVIDRDGRVAARALGPVTVQALRKYAQAVATEGSTTSESP